MISSTTPNRSNNPMPFPESTIRVRRCEAYEVCEVRMDRTGTPYDHGLGIAISRPREGPGSFGAFVGEAGTLTHSYETDDAETAIEAVALLSGVKVGAIEWADADADEERAAKVEGGAA